LLPGIDVESIGFFRAAIFGGPILFLATVIIMLAAMSGADAGVRLNRLRYISATLVGIATGYLALGATTVSGTVVIYVLVDDFAGLLAFSWLGFFLPFLILMIAAFLGALAAYFAGKRVTFAMARYTCSACGATFASCYPRVTCEACDRIVCL
jgi:hypothetical protein